MRAPELIPSAWFVCFALGEWDKLGGSCIRRARGCYACDLRMRMMGSAWVNPPEPEGRRFVLAWRLSSKKPVSFVMQGQNGSAWRLPLPAKIRLCELNIRLPFLL